MNNHGYWEDKYSTTTSGGFGNEVGFNGGCALGKGLKLVPKAPTILEEQTLWTKKLKRLSPRLKELMNMLSYARPYDSATELDFITTYIDTLPCVTEDGFGNRIVKIGKETPKVCWTSHTDTVHWDEGRQAIEIDVNGDIALDALSDANCLGADCTAGVWLMRRMILAGKSGLYIFHRQEEIGGNGSQWIANNTPELVADIEAMISLDRRGVNSVITEQSTGITASNAFAKSLAAMLPSGFKPDPTGMFTDSAFYSHLIPECSNISTGMDHCHSWKEVLDYQFTDHLLGFLLKLDYEQLAIERKPVPAYSFGFAYSADANDRWSEDIDGYGIYYEDDTFEILEDGRTMVTMHPSKATYIRDFKPSDLDRIAEQSKQVKVKRTKSHDTSNTSVHDHNLAYMASHYPEACALLLEQLGISEIDIYEAHGELGL